MGSSDDSAVQICLLEGVDSGASKTIRPKWRNGRGRKLMLEHRKRARRRKKR